MQFQMWYAFVKPYMEIKCLSRGIYFPSAWMNLCMNVDWQSIPGCADQQRGGLISLKKQTNPFQCAHHETPYVLDSLNVRFSIMVSFHSGDVH